MLNRFTDAARRAGSRFEDERARVQREHAQLAELRRADAPQAPTIERLDRGVRFVVVWCGSVRPLERDAEKTGTATVTGSDS